MNVIRYLRRLVSRRRPRPMHGPRGANPPDAGPGVTLEEAVRAEVRRYEADLRELAKT